MQYQKLRVGFVQNTVSLNQPEKTFSHIKQAISKLIKNRVQVILLPEMCLGSSTRKTALQELDGTYDSLLSELTEISKHSGTHFYTSIRSKTPSSQKAFNQALWVSPAAKARTYNKIHLFCLDGEQKRYSKGSQSVVWKTPWGKVMPLICYDIRFPELLRKGVFQGARLAWVCAQWPKTRKDHWFALLKARAIENQVFVIACNRRGNHKGLAYGGDSCVFSPWGERVYHQKNQLVGFYDLDLSLIEKTRARFPFLQDALKTHFRFDI